MRTRTLFTVALAVGVLTSGIAAYGRGGFGGGGGGGRGGGGGGRGGGGGGGARMGGGGGGMARPAPRPSSMPSYSGRGGGGGGARPSYGGAGGGGRPAISPQPGGGARPGGGLGPGAGPGGTTRPATRPAILGGGGAAGGVRPGGGGGDRPGGGSLPALGGGTRPGVTRPGILGPGGGGGAPGGAGGVRPGAGGGGRPSAGDLGDFLGMQGGIGPGGATTLPGGGGNRPGGGGGGAQFPAGDIAGGGIRPGGGGTQWPRGNVPGSGVSPGGGGSETQWRPGNGRPGGWAGGIDHGIHQRPNWANINNVSINTINNNWASAITRPVRPGQRPWSRPGSDRWSTWGGNVRNNWHYGHWNNNWFDGNWFNNHMHSWPGWHYGWRFNNYPASYWWTIPAWGAVTNWFDWNDAPAQVWSQPVYYDYGTDGNVTYQEDSVYIGGEQVATADEFAESAAALSTVAPPATEEQAAAAEWMPLGTFAVSTNEKEVNPTHVMQLAVDKQGVLSGTMYNKVSDETEPIEGQVDKQTQRVAFRIGDNQNVIAETGLYNLTQDEVPLLVHYGTERTENYLLVRLEAPADSAGGATGAAPVSAPAPDPFAP